MYFVDDPQWKNGYNIISSFLIYTFFISLNSIRAYMPPPIVELKFSRSSPNFLYII